jgi:anti-anti-sigma factor
LKGFDVEVDRRADCVVVRPVGELDLSAVDAVEQALIPLEREFTEIVVDLRAVEFLDSAGLRAILASDARSRQDAFRLRVINGGTQVQKVLSLTGMDKHLTLVDADELSDRG